MNKIFNIYCDESCYIEHDHKKYMFLANVNCAYPKVKHHSERIKELKKKHNFYGEIKWTNVSKSKLSFYLELLDYFFDADIRFRAVAVDKESLKKGGVEYNYDDLYYKMYYRLLNDKVDTSNLYNVYLDIKDTWSNQKVKRLEVILNTQFGVFQKIQCIDSKESILLQLADLLMGALAYNANDAEKKNPAKVKIIEVIKRHCQESDLLHDYSSTMFNLSFINMQ